MWNKENCKNFVIMTAMLKRRMSCLAEVSALTSARLREIYNHQYSDRRSYRNDDEVQPAPGIGEILLETVRRPLHYHFAHEYNAERLVHVLQNHHQRLSFLYVHVFYCLHIVNIPYTVRNFVYIT